VPSASIKPSFWRREHHLDRMNMKQLVVAYFQYPAVIAYLLLAAVSTAVWFVRPAGPIATIASVMASIVLYPLVW
jgi:hypothetical protein